MSDLKRLQNEYGGELGEIMQRPAMFAAGSHLEQAVIDDILTVTDEEIQAHGGIKLAGFRERFKSIRELFALPTKADLKFQHVPEGYADPLSEIEPPPIDNSAPPQDEPPKPSKRKK